MKRCVSINLRFLVLLALLLQGAPAGNAISQSRKSGELNMSPETWPKDELEKCWRLQRTYFQSHPAAESSQGMVAVTSEAFAARAGLEALRQGGSAADAALAAALAQVALTAGSEISYAGILTMVYSLGLPSGGGVDAIEALNLLEAADLKQYGHYTASPEALYEFIQICRASIYLNNFPLELFKEYAPEIALAPVDRVKKENARLLWQKMHEPAWQKMLSVVNPKSDGNKHSAGVVAVDARGNVAALAHSINTFDWGGSGIFVDGVSIPDSASFQQGKIARLKPGDRLPDQIDPKTGKRVGVAPSWLNGYVTGHRAPPGSV